MAAYQYHMGVLAGCALGVGGVTDETAMRCSADMDGRVSEDGKVGSHVSGP
jgi:hypothetical protein